MAGFFHSIKLVGVLVLAIPAALAGLEFLVVRGDVIVGGTLLTLSFALVAIHRFLSFPTDPKSALVRYVTGSSDPDSTAPESDDDRD